MLTLPSPEDPFVNNRNYLSWRNSHQIRVISAQLKLAFSAVERIWCSPGVVFLQITLGRFFLFITQDCCLTFDEWEPRICWVDPTRLQTHLGDFFSWTELAPRHFLPRAEPWRYLLDTSLHTSHLELGLRTGHWLVLSPLIASFPINPQIPNVSAFPWKELRKRERKIHLERRLVCTLFTTECKKK